MNTENTNNTGVVTEELTTENSNVNPVEATEPTVSVAAKAKVVRQTFELQFPDGEFTVGALVAQTGKKQPSVFLKVREAIKRGEVREVRREQLAKRGRPSVIYSKV